MSNVPSSPRRARFSLHTLLLVMAIVALAMAQFVALRRIREVEARNQELFNENVKLRVEAGYLKVEDRRKMAVLRLRELDELTWRWKVFLPKGIWVIHSETSKIPQTGLTKPTKYDAFGGNQEISLAASVRKGADGRWEFVTDFGGLGRRRDLAKSHALVAPRRTGNEESVSGSGKQETLDPDKPIVLLRLRPKKRVESSPGSWTGKETPEPTDGILIWIERKK